METLKELQKWYHSQCDGDWEHGYGLEIGTLDNPGWRVSINLVDTDLAEQPFAEVQRLEHEADWIHCRIRDGKWEGYGGPFMLEHILRTFLAWSAERHSMTTQRPTHDGQVTGIASYTDYTPATSASAHFKPIRWEDAPDRTIEIRQR